MADGPIKAIETRYKGCRFRSRLEARWAVFFDALGIAWLYEPEGFEISFSKNLGDIFDPKFVDLSSKYLPDFYLPDLGLYMEVKGTSATQDERAKCDALAQMTQRAVLLVSGMPYERPAHIWCWSVDESAGSYDSACTLLFHNPIAQVLLHSPLPRNMAPTLFFGGDFTDEVDLVDFVDFTPLPHWSPGLEEARSARFEHGETPVTAYA